MRAAPARLMPGDVGSTHRDVYSPIDTSMGIKVTVERMIARNEADESVVNYPGPKASAKHLASSGRLVAHSNA
jgi:hypothetical protein